MEHLAKIAHKIPSKGIKQGSHFNEVEEAVLTLFRQCALAQHPENTAFYTQHIAEWCRQYVHEAGFHKWWVGAFYLPASDFGRSLAAEARDLGFTRNHKKKANRVTYMPVMPGDKDTMSESHAIQIIKDAKKAAGLL